MGIAGFTKWVIKNFPEIVRIQHPRYSQFYDHVAFDLNQILHNAALKAKSRALFVQLLYKEINQTLRCCSPKKSIYFAFDGPAPLAKLITQKSRRRSQGKKSRKGAVIDRLELTPGVDLMYFVRDAIEYWVQSQLKRDEAFRNLRVHISGADVAGEGELKVIDYCNHVVNGTDESFCVVGGDADIFLQGLATTKVKNFFVFLHRSRIEIEKAHRKKLAPKNVVLSVWAFTRSLEKKFPGEGIRARIDFIVMSILRGNDYVPKLRGTKMDGMWKRYTIMRTSGGEILGRGMRNKPRRVEPSFKGQFLIDAANRTFNWQFLHALLSQSCDYNVPRLDIPEDTAKSKETTTELGPESNHVELPTSGVRSGTDDPMLCTNEDDDSEDLGEEIEGEDLGVEMEADEVMTDDVDVDDDDDVELNDENDDDYDEEVVDVEEQHIERLMSIASSSSTTKQTIYDVELYCRCLLWTLQMYIDGYCGDYSFRYQAKYGPSARNLISWISAFDGDPLPDVRGPISNSPPLPPYLVAAVLLPRPAKHLLPESYRERVSQLPETASVQQVINAVGHVDGARGFGVPLVFSRDSDGIQNVTNAQPPQPPGGQNRLGPLQEHPIVFKGLSPVSTSPPCREWPGARVRETSGEEENLMDIRYMVAACGKGNALKKRSGNARQANAAQANRNRKQGQKKEGVGSNSGGGGGGEGTKGVGAGTRTGSNAGVGTGSNVRAGSNAGAGAGFNARTGAGSNAGAGAFNTGARAGSNTGARTNPNAGPRAGFNTYAGAGPNTGAGPSTGASSNTSARAGPSTGAGSNAGARAGPSATGASSNVGVSTSGGSGSGSGNGSGRIANNNMNGTPAFQGERSGSGGVPDGGGDSGGGRGGGRGGASGGFTGRIRGKKPRRGGSRPRRGRGRGGGGGDSAMGERDGKNVNANGAGPSSGDGGGRGGGGGNANMSSHQNHPNNGNMRKRGSDTRRGADKGAKRHRGEFKEQKS